MNTLPCVQQFDVRTGRLIRQPLATRAAVRTEPPVDTAWLTYDEPCRTTFDDADDGAEATLECRARFWFASRTPGKVWLVVYPARSGDPFPLLVWDFRVEPPPAGDAERRYDPLPAWAVAERLCRLL